MMSIKTGFGKKGFGLVEMLVALVVTTQAMLALGVLVQVMARSSSSTSANITTSEVKSLMLSFILNPDNWTATLDDPTNLAFLKAQMASHGGGEAPLRLVRPDGTVFYSNAANMGISPNGAICTGYSATTRNAACPATYDLKWKVLCENAGTCDFPRLEITANFSYQQASSEEIPRFNLAQMSFQISQSIPDVDDFVMMPQMITVNKGSTGNSVAMKLTDPRLAKNPIEIEPVQEMVMDGAEVTVSGSQITYRPNPLFYGRDRFRFEAKYERFGRSYSTRGLVIARVMTPYTWVGDARDQNFYSQRNWCGQVVSGRCSYDAQTDAPSMARAAVVFNENCPGNTCQAIAAARGVAPLTLNSLEMTPGFLGTVTLRTSLNIAFRKGGTLANEADQCRVNRTTVSIPVGSSYADADTLVTYGLLRVNGGTLVVDSTGLATVLEVTTTNGPGVSFAGTSFPCLNSINVSGNGRMQFLGAPGSIALVANNGDIDLNTDNLINSDVLNLTYNKGWGGAGFGLTVTGTQRLNVNQFSSSAGSSYGLDGVIRTNDLTWSPQAQYGMFVYRTADAARSRLEVTGNIKMTEGSVGSLSYNFPDSVAGTITMVGDADQRITGLPFTDAEILNGRMFSVSFARTGGFYPGLAGLPNITIDKPLGGTVTLANTVNISGRLEITPQSRVDASAATLVLASDGMHNQIINNSGSPLQVQNLVLASLNTSSPFSLTGAIRVSNNLLTDFFYPGRVLRADNNSIIFLEGDWIARRLGLTPHASMPSLLVELSGNGDQTIRSDFGGEGTDAFCAGARTLIGGIETGFCNSGFGGLVGVRINKNSGNVNLQGSLNLMSDFQVQQLSGTLDMTRASINTQNWGTSNTFDLRAATGTVTELSDLRLASSYDFNNMLLTATKSITFTNSLPESAGSPGRVRNVNFRLLSAAGRTSLFSYENQTDPNNANISIEGDGPVVVRAKEGAVPLELNFRINKSGSYVRQLTHFPILKNLVFNNGIWDQAAYNLQTTRTIEVDGGGPAAGTIQKNTLAQTTTILPGAEPRLSLVVVDQLPIGQRAPASD